MRPKLSVIIITRNEAAQITECLASVSWAEEIIVVDAESTDDTVTICKNHPAKLFIRPWPGFASQKQFALDQAQNDWVLSLDADERVTPELKTEIELKLQNPAGHDGFYIPRQGFFLGKWIRHCGWYPGYQLRLFRKSTTRLSEAHVHEGFIVSGPTGYFKSAMLHYSHPTLFTSFAKMNHYSGLEALDRKARRVTWLDLLTHPLSEFLRKYFVKMGFLDGWHGLLLCLVAAYTKMALYMKIWELQQKPEDWTRLSVQHQEAPASKTHPMTVESTADSGHFSLENRIHEKRATLSVIVITFNEEHNIAACLESVRWADELIVVDSKSTDRTREIARAFTQQVIEAEWQGYAANKNLALAQAKGEWILWLDADERVTPALAEEIRHAIQFGTGEVGFSMPRKAFFLGRWIRHCGWYPGHVLRLFRREIAYINDNLVHEGVEIQGPVGQFRNDILHFTDLNLNHYLWKFNRYTSLAAQQLHKRGYRSHWWDILLRPWHTFLKMYLLKAGFLDGMQGFMLSLLSGGYVFAKYAKVWELSRNILMMTTKGSEKSEPI